MTQKVNFLFSFFFHFCNNIEEEKLATEFTDMYLVWSSLDVGLCVSRFVETKIHLLLVAGTLFCNDDVLGKQR